MKIGHSSQMRSIFFTLKEFTSRGGWRENKLGLFETSTLSLKLMCPTVVFSFTLAAHGFTANDFAHPFY
jgi:hypothetical protein